MNNNQLIHWLESKPRNAPPRQWIVFLLKNNQWYKVGDTHTKLDEASNSVPFFSDEKGKYYIYNSAGQYVKHIPKRKNRKLPIITSSGRLRMVS